MEGIRKGKHGGKRGSIFAWLVAIPVLVQLGLPVDIYAEPDAGASISKPDSATRARIEENFGKLPLYFIENRGQMDSRVTHYVKGRDKSLFFTSQGVTFLLRGKGELSSTPGAVISRASYSPDTSKLDRSLRWAVRLEFLGANADVKPAGIDRTKAVVSYFKGKRDEWNAGVKTYGGVMYRDLWPGIDLIYTGTVNSLKYKFVVKPGADPNIIRLAYRGASSIAINDAGQLEVKTPVGGFQDERPYTYQDVDGQRVEVATAYTLAPDGAEGAKAYGFMLGHYDKTRPLVLDPAVLVYCGFLGGIGKDSSGNITVDGSGNAYVTGYTESATTFPVTVGPDLTYNDEGDAFVAKVNSSGIGLIYCGFIGGSGTDRGHDIAVDDSGNAYVTGYTGSNENTFPVTVGPDLTRNGGWDAFVAKVNSLGTDLLYCGYIGGSLGEAGKDISVDDFGNAYVAGETGSSEATFPVIVGPDLTYNGGIMDAFVAKVNSTGTGLLYCGYIGGSSGDYGNGVAVDDSGNAYITGSTSSDETTFPVTVGPDLTYNGSPFADGFVAKVNSSGTGLLYCGYIGGSSGDYGNGIAVDHSDIAYIIGNTSSDEATFPVTVGPDLTFNGLPYDVFVAKVNFSGTSLLYCGYIGGSDQDTSGGIAVDGDGNAYVGGLTWSSEAEGFPVTVGPDLTHNGGDSDAYTAKVNFSGSGLLYCGYIGGSGYETGNGIAVDGYGNAYVTGWTSSTEATFPVIVGPDLTYNGNGDTFIAKVSAQADGDELALDFAANGLWHYDGSSWTSLAGWNPDGMVDWTGGMAVDFDTYGAWNYDGTTWSQLAGWNPEDGIAWNSGLAVDFGPNGLWHYDGSSWTSLASWDSYGMAEWTGGLAVYFGATYGLWNYDGSSWTNLASWEAEGGIAWNNGLAIDFISNGLWYYDGSFWTSLAGWNPDGMVEWTGGLAVDFGATYGLWNYDGTTWTQLAGWNPEDDMVNWTDGLAVDFGPNGLWSYDGSSWTSLATWNPEEIEAWANGLAVDFGASYGLWNYDGSSWSNLAGWDSEDMIDIDLY